MKNNYKTKAKVCLVRVPENFKYFRFSLSLFTRTHLKQFVSDIIKQCVLISVSDRYIIPMPMQTPSSGAHLAQQMYKSIALRFM